MAWEFVNTEVDLYSREYLQYFVTIIAFIFVIVVSTLTGNCTAGLALIIILGATIPLIYFILKMRTIKDYLRNSFKDLLDELDNLK